MRKIGEGYDSSIGEDKLDDAAGELVEPFFKRLVADFSGVMFRPSLSPPRDCRKTRSFLPTTAFRFWFCCWLAKLRTDRHIPLVLILAKHTVSLPKQAPEAARRRAPATRDAPSRFAASRARLRIGPSGPLQILPERRMIPLVQHYYLRKMLGDAGSCLKSVSEKTSYSKFEVILMDNETTDERSLQLMEQYPVRRIPFPNPFNFSRANNQGAMAAAGDFLVFLNNDTEIVTEDWLEHLLYYAEQPEVVRGRALLTMKTARSNMLSWPSECESTADHTMRGFPIASMVSRQSRLRREVSAVTPRA